MLVRQFVPPRAARRTNRKVTWIASTAMDALARALVAGEHPRAAEYRRAVGDPLGWRTSCACRCRNWIARLRRGESPRVAGESLEEAERAHIVAALKATGWMLSGPRGAAARPQGMNRSTLQFRMKKLGIERPALGD